MISGVIIPVLPRRCDYSTARPLLRPAVVSGLVFSSRMLSDSSVWLQVQLFLDHL